MGFWSDLLAALGSRNRPKPPAPPPPQPATKARRALAIIVQDPRGRPIAGARVAMMHDAENLVGATNADGYVLFSPYVGSPINVAIEADGFEARRQDVHIPYDGNRDVVFGPNAREEQTQLEPLKPTKPPTPEFPPAGNRGALPPFDRDSTDPESGAPLRVNTQLWYTPPPVGDLRYWRGNAWGIEIDGLPRIPGGADGPAQRRVLTYLLDRYPSDWQDRIFEAHHARRYDRLVLSWPDSRSNGQSQRDYVDMAARVKAAGLYPVHFLTSKVYDGRNPNPSQLDDVLGALLDADAITHACIGWELNFFWDPIPLQRAIDYLAPKLVDAGVYVYVHFSSWYPAWQPDRPGGSGADFWNANKGKLRGLLYQADPPGTVVDRGAHAPKGEVTVGMINAKINDVLTRFHPSGTWKLGDSGFGHPFDCVAFEYFGDAQFYDRHALGYDASEARGDLIGYELLSTIGPIPVMGFCGGARYPNGDPI